MPTVNERILTYWEFARAYLVKDGQPTKELSGMRDALRALRKLYGRLPAADFGPRGLKAVRQHMIDVDRPARTEVNKRIGRIKRVFKWAVGEEWVPPSAYHALQAVSGLHFGRTAARETDPVRPVPDEHVDAVLPFVAPPIAAMIRLKRLTGMRPGEVVILRRCDIDMSREVGISDGNRSGNAGVHLASGMTAAPTGARLTMVWRKPRNQELGFHTGTPINFDTPARLKSAGSTASKRRKWR